MTVRSKNRRSVALTEKIPSEVQVKGSVACMEIGNGLRTMFNISDLGVIMRHKWAVDMDVRPINVFTTINGKKAYMDRFLMCKGGKLLNTDIVIHGNGDSLDNRRDNLSAIKYK